jgi:cobalt-zinc-cadmium efflux system outer membrane protein
MCRIVSWILVVGVCAFQSATAAPPESDEDLLPAPLPVATRAFQRPTDVPTEPPPAASPALPVDLTTALEWTLSRNPDLIAIRQNLRVSQAALAVAQRFPTSLNPTVSVDVRPWVFEKSTGQGSRGLENQVAVSWAQPIELGGRTGFRTEIARAAFNQTQWNILQAELAALVQTYRLHQTATYRHEKLRVAQQLAEFNRQLVKTVDRQMQANQIPPVDVALAEVESQVMDQQKEAALQDYAVALTELRQQVGIGEYMSCLEPSGPLQLPEEILAQDEDNLVRTALESRPEVHAAQAQVAGSRAAVCLARADRIPIPSIGTVYEKDNSGTSFYGLVVSTPIPVLNAGRTLVSQREAEWHRDSVVLEQTKQRVSNQVKAALIKWRQAQRLVKRTRAMIEPIKAQASRVDRLYAAGQSDLVKLLQVRQRLIQVENSQLDAIWQSTQAYADLLTALGATPLVGSVGATTDSPSLQRY